MASPISNRKLSELTKDELKKVLKKASFRGYNVNRLASALANGNIDKLNYNSMLDQISFLRPSDGKPKHIVRWDNIKKDKFSWSLIRFFKKSFCCFNKNEFNVKMDDLAVNLHLKIQEANKTTEKPLSEKDFLLMKTVLQKQSKEVEVPLYEKGTDAPKEFLTVKYNAGAQAIEVSDFNDAKKLAFQLDNEGGLLSCTIDGEVKTVQEIPADRKDWLLESFKFVIELSSNYKPKAQEIEISVLKRGIEKNPAAHLNKLSDALKKMLQTVTYPRLNVVLLKEDLSTGEGRDNGGISRDYLNSLFSFLVESADSGVLFKAQKHSGVFLPVSTQKGIESGSLSTLIPGLNSIEQRICQEIGRVMMFCYRSEPNTVDFKNYAYAIGQHFDPLLFEVALTMDSNTIDASFEDLSLQSKGDLAKKILEKLLKLDDAKHKCALVDLLSWKQGQSLPKLKFSAVLETLNPYLNEGYAKFFTDDTDALDMTAINAEPAEFVQAILKELLNEKVGTTSVGELMAPLHAIAQGLKIDNWDQTIGNGHITSRDFNDKIQGSLDRNTIVSAFKVEVQILDNQGEMVDRPQKEIKEINKKTKWLQNWILAPETRDQDIRKFLVYTTGLNALSKDQEITIKGQNISQDKEQNRKGVPAEYTPVPAATTCQHMLSMSPEPCGYDLVNDKTEKAFIAMLYSQILSDKSFGINMD